MKKRNLCGSGSSLIALMSALTGCSGEPDALPPGTVATAEPAAECFVARIR